MTEKVNKGDFVEIEYVGRIKDLGAVFDCTNEEIAKKEGIFNPGMAYGPISLCVGEGQILKGLDTSLVGLEVGADSKLTLPPEDAFGKKDAKLIRLIPTNVFKKQGINPMPGLQVNIDGAVGTVKTVSGGRTIVDFNHPFSSKEVEYDVKVMKLITDDKEKVLALLELALNQKKDAIKLSLEAGKATIELKKNFPDELLKTLKERVLRLVPAVKELDWNMPVVKEVKAADLPVENTETKVE